MFNRAALVAALVLVSLAEASTENDIMVPLSDDRVVIELYYESECPFCRNFMAEQLGPVLNLTVISVFISGNLGHCRF